MHFESIVDAQGRRLGNLRVSLTSACNYACIYCVADGKRLHARDDSLPLDKLLLAVEYLKTVNPLGRLRITGGEPLISPLFDGFMKAVRRLDFGDVSLTSNGQLLSRKLPLLLEAGVKRINISLDTLDAEAFQRIAGGGDLATVLKGIDQALAAGLQVKINMVPLRGNNHDQILPLLEYCLVRGMTVRGIKCGQIAIETGFNFLQSPSKLGTGEIPIPIVDRFELAAIDGSERFRENPSCWHSSTN
jgi:cyclic pyranopterin phosphate synthase